VDGVTAVPPAVLKVIWWTSLITELGDEEVVLLEFEPLKLLLPLKELAELFPFDSRMASARVPRDVEIIDATKTAVTAATKVPMINRKPSLLNVFITIPPYGIRFGFLVTSA
jgi:hypothetical protein